MANHSGACPGDSLSLGSLKGSMNIRAPSACSCLASAGLLFSVLTPSQALATVADLSYAVAATATDYGPQDGVFDAFAPLNFGSVNNNGFISFRTALEFDISAVPAGSVINAATLTIVVGFVEGTRQVVLNGYPGNGEVSLSDFSLDGLVGNATLNPPGSQTLTFDATAFLGSLLNSGEAFAGFNIREDPANLSNFTVFNVLDFEPRLSIDFVGQAVPEPSALSLLGAGWLAVLCVTGIRGRRKPAF